MALTVSAALSQAGSPRPVRVFVEGLEIGAPYRVTGSAGGLTWIVRGGRGEAASSSQLVLTDIMTPLGRSITYRASSGDETAVALETVRVSYPASVMFQSLDGSSLIDVEVWRDNRDPVNTFLDSYEHRVSGRRNPVGRFAPAGGESGAWEMVLTTPNTQRLREHLRSSVFLVMRMNPHIHYNETQCDIPAVRVVMLRDVSRVMHGVPGKRVWSLTWVEIDDPHADTVMVSDTLADVDAAYEGNTLADLDAAYPGATMADWNKFDWAGAAL